MCDHLNHDHVLPSRRQFLGAGLGLLALSALPNLRAYADASPPQNAITPDAALRRLMQGNARYAANQLDAKDFSSGRAARAKAQYPIAAILGCADSRVAPELVFDQGPGDIFVIRIAGNYLSGDGLASLEYAVGVLKTPLIMVLGHAECGAVKATIHEMEQPAPLPGHIWDIVDAVRPGVTKAVEAGGDHVLANAIGANVDYNVSRIASAQPVISEAVRSGSVKVVGAVYELATGKVLLRASA
ncbi:carbonic anhydrase [Dyella nitratireducens]|uniref:Carbonic anhydrase n=1 Tax=Dyella nitratireducens TaxID=1849580 RepID=A0ABQ1FTL2_9GAMM|nr:carbonic anhydrase [Dyella nitratireducens]GGA29182.1 carbonic anhydrase [Dyella nitratireducens]GLQ43178.1 carbonic anhydrase [Dyella nitratireducens]